MTIVEPTPYTQRVAIALAMLGECVCEQLATVGAGPTCWCGLYPGQTASWDYCGECQGDVCGMGYVRLATVFPYSTFPVETIDARCTLPTAWAVEVGALRCLPTPATGELLGPEAMAEVAIRQVLDAGAIHTALKCCGLDVAVNRWQPLGPSGGCVGGAWLAFLAVD